MKTKCAEFPEKTVFFGFWWLQRAVKVNATQFYVKFVFYEVMNF
jgi:hypothetical protein